MHVPDRAPPIPLPNDAFAPAPSAGRANAARAFLIALVMTTAVWGRFLLPGNTLSPEAAAQSINPRCRVATPALTCQAQYAALALIDPGAPAWVNIPDDYYFRRARAHGEPRPRWNPYVGSGYPVALDGHSSALSPVQWFQSRVPGDTGRDVVVFARFLAWTFGIVWAVAMLGGTTALLLVIGLVATVAPYAAAHVDIVFLDSDLLGPWFLVVLLAFRAGTLRFPLAAALSVALGALVFAMGFAQSGVSFLCAMGVLGLACATGTRGRSLALVGSLAIGALLAYPAWLPLARNLDQFVSERTVHCIAEQGFGLAYVRGLVLHPPFGVASFAMVTLVAAALLPFTPRRAWFVAVAAVVFVAWIALGLPHQVCSVPLVSGIRFSRHLQAHVQLCLIVAAGAASQAIADRLRHRWPWIVFAGASVVAVWYGIDPEVGVMGARVLGCAAVGLALGGVAARLRRGADDTRASRAAFAAALAVFAFTPFLLGSPIVLQMLRGEAHATEVAPLPTELDPTTALGAVQRASAREDRRHYSVGEFIYPNWSGALGILDLLSLNALYPVAYHELNGGLFDGWVGDEGHGLKPDRFVPVPPDRAMTPSFQRVLAVNRVSLLTFVAGEARFADSGSPYARSRCRLLARDGGGAIGYPFAESWVCPDVGGVGYFPRVVKTVASRAEALALLRAMTPGEIVDVALIGPEIDLSPAPAGSAAAAVPALGRVVSFERRGDDLRYVLDVERAGVFVVADTYFRGWTATVNGAPAGISRANVAFKAVHVPAGRVDLKLHFQLVM